MPLAFNIAASFITNTDWQVYAGETTLSYLTQMLVLAVQNFLCAATGMAALFALIRSLLRSEQAQVGNFWVDLTRSVIYLLLPLSILFSLFLVSQGVIQSFAPYVEVQTLEGAKQIIPLGPVASQEAIKMLGVNGGGFFNVNSAHPFENPTGLSNFLETLAMLLIPAASVYMYGRLVKNTRHGWILFGIMFFLLFVGVIVAYYSESLYAIKPFLEGKETRFGVDASLLWAVSATASSSGSVNAMISSFTPIAGGICMFNMMLGELIFGGIGVGLCGMLMFVILTVFLSGLMVGRTPEYFGKKIEKREIQWAMVAILGPCALILLGSGLSSIISYGVSCLGNTGPHGFSEILYAFSSCAANNGSAFAGINANTDYYNLVLGVVMLLARLAILVPTIALAGLFAQKKTIPVSSGTFSTESWLFAILLTSVILIVGALTFFPALSLGPIVEQFLMLRGVNV